MIETEGDIALAGIILVHLTDAIDEFHHIRLLTMQLQLLLVNLTYIQDLIHQIQDTFRIMLDGIDIAQGIRLISAGKTTFQVGQRTHNQCQRRTDIVRGINQEFHLFFVHLLGSTTTIGHKDIDTYGHQDGEIDEIGQLGAIPRSTYLQYDLFLWRIFPTLLGTHMNMIGAWLQVAQRKLIDTNRITNPVTIINTIFENHVHGIIEIHLREAQRNRMVQIAQCKMITLAHRLICNNDTIQFGITGHSTTAYQHTRQLQRCQRGDIILKILGIEHRETITMGEEDTVFIRVHTNTIKEFLLGKAISSYITDKIMRIDLILPDTL